MDITPLTKTSLRGLYAATQEEARQKKISEIVQGIYAQVLTTSKSSPVTVYKHECRIRLVNTSYIECRGCSMPHSINGGGLSELSERPIIHKREPVGRRPVYHIHKLDPFYEANMEEILVRLQFIFPDSSIQYTPITKSQDGTVLILSTVDASLRSLITIAEELHYIVIDWS
jgi:hypothetical protein